MGSDGRLCRDNRGVNEPPCGRSTIDYSERFEEMCGVVGYVGTQQAASILLDGLRRLEYRGYDSAGVAVHDGKSIEVVRTVGKLRELAGALSSQSLEGTTGIGHTRWATHGRPSEANAHPHVVGGIAVVHNGIVENFEQLRGELIARGTELRSETDTEIIAHLIREQHDDGAPRLLEAVRRALEHVRGSYAIVVASEDEPGKIVAARCGSPLVLGRNEGEVHVGSDMAALLPHTRTMTFLEDGDVVELTADGFSVETLAGEVVERQPTTVDYSPTMVERGGYKHFMLKEIHEQPDAIAATLNGRIDLGEGDLNPTEMGLDPEVAKKIRRVYVVACGTSYHAGLVGRYWIEDIAQVPTVVDIGSEVAVREPLFSEDDLVIAISQSGETFDTIKAVEAAKRRGATVLSVCNVLGSQIPRLADGTLFTRAGPEVGVASTKCFTVQLAAMMMIAIYLGRRRGTVDQSRARELLRMLTEVPAHMNELLRDADYVRHVATSLRQAQDVLFLGRRYSYPLALEGALKLKEVSYAHAEGYAAGEMKHGPIALIEDGLPVIVLAPKDSCHEKTLGNVQEVRAREGMVIAISTRGDESVHDLADHVLWLPEADELITPILQAVPLQLLAYYVATRRGCDVDQPRNLAKTVTVE